MPEAVPRSIIRPVTVRPCMVTLPHAEHRTFIWPEEWCLGIAPAPSLIEENQTNE